ncbi:unnamed protein product [Caenorhabditis angaria]|uniref:Uncharacterized protein n=1 Tax=Caenorhabditis angaria TaxID=860376 RepID=A0A9P1MYD5_9PELO|nr:unnamed protein product [Caenorhabditis angaria]
MELEHLPRDFRIPNSKKSHFPRGLGELTDRGFENSWKLGEFLAERYVKSGFLNADMKSREMYWRSVYINRCLATAATVGAAMFSGAKKHLHPAISTEESDETLLNYDTMNCRREHEIYEELCPGYQNMHFRTWPEFEEFIANCLNFTRDPIFEKIKFSEMEAHLNEYKNDIPLPEILEINKQKISKFYTQVTHKILGIGEFQNIQLMRIKFGNLIKTLQENMKKAWSCFEEGEHCTRKMKKFKVYSTQDWILMGVLEVFGVLNITLGQEMAEYNTMIILELWSIDKNPEIKLFFKKDEVKTELIQIKPEEIRGKKLDLQGFLECCTEYWNNGTSACDAKFLKSRDFVASRRRKRFAGPE